MAKRINMNKMTEWIFGEKVTYSGSCKQKGLKPDGYGEAVYQNGDRFVGIFSSGLPIRGTYTYSNGSYCTVFYEYNFSKTNRTKYFVTSTGYGCPEPKSRSSETYSNGRYVGEIKNGERSGIGTYTWNSGEIYSGGWYKNKKHGVGKYTYSSGNYDWCVYDEGKVVCTLRYVKKNAGCSSSYQDSDYEDYSYDYSDYEITYTSSFQDTKDDIYDRALHEINYGSRDDALRELKRLRSFCYDDEYEFVDEFGHSLNIKEQIEELENS